MSPPGSEAVLRLRKLNGRFVRIAVIEHQNLQCPLSGLYRHLTNGRFGGAKLTFGEYNSLACAANGRSEPKTDSI